jgi:chromosome segregation ATPase
MSPPETVREVAARLDGLREFLLARLDAIRVEVKVLREVVNERDTRYTERATAQAGAIEKAEAAQREYNARSNEFRGQLDDQAKRLISRVDAESMVASHADKLARVDSDLRTLTDRVNQGGGMTAGSRASQDTARANVLLALAFFGAVVTGGGIVAAIAVALSR